MNGYAVTDTDRKVFNQCQALQGGFDLTLSTKGRMLTGIRSDNFVLFYKVPSIFEGQLMIKLYGS